MVDSIVGLKKDTWEVIKRTGVKNSQAIYCCQCACGEVREFGIQKIMGKTSLICGNKIHKKTNKKESQTTSKIWNNEKHLLLFPHWVQLLTRYPNIDERWLDYEACKNDIGLHVKHSRIVIKDKNKPLGPDNFEFSSDKCVIEPGEKFGRWTAIKPNDLVPSKNREYICQCSCGTIKSLKIQNLVSNRTHCCRKCSLEIKKNNYWAMKEKEQSVDGAFSILQDNINRTMVNFSAAAQKHSELRDAHAPQEQLLDAYNNMKKIAQSLRPVAKFIEFDNPHMEELIYMLWTE